MNASKVSAKALAQIDLWTMGWVKEHLEARLDTVGNTTKRDGNVAGYTWADSD